MPADAITALCGLEILALQPEDDVVIFDGLNDALDALRTGAHVAYPRGVEPEPQSRPGVNLHAYDGRATPELFERLNRWIEAGPFSVCVSSTYPLDRAALAHQALDQHHLGKLALKVRDS